MQCLYLDKSIVGSYVKDSLANVKLCVVADWLTDDVNGAFEFCYDWLSGMDEASNDVEFNATWLEKDGDVITMGSLADIMIYWPKGLDVPAENKVVLSTKNAIELIDSWRKLLKIRPERIMIYEEDRVYRLEEVQ